MPVAANPLAPDKVQRVTGVAITAGTPVAVLTPTAGTKFRLLAFWLGPSAGAVLRFMSGADAASATEFLRTPALGTSNTPPLVSLGAGLAPGAINHVLALDATTSASVNGFILYTEE